MGLFKSLFGDSDSEKQQPNIEWKPLESVLQLESIIAESAQKPALIFKHSTRCGISRMVLKQFEANFALENKVTPYFLDLLEHRDVSDAITQEFNVVHQSPQLLLIVEGKSVYDESHGEIDAGKIVDFIL